MSRSNRGFALVEMIIVVAIVGVLAAIAITQYAHLFEKARVDEAKQALWEIRVTLEQYRMDHRDPPSGMADLGLSAVKFPVDCRPEKFFQYSFDATHVIATRCTQSGKSPQSKIAYIVSLNLENSTWGGTPGYY